jgi:hypothetical protein
MAAHYIVDARVMAYSEKKKGIWSSVDREPTFFGSPSQLISYSLSFAFSGVIFLSFL